MPVQNLQTLCITAALPFWPLTTGLGEARTKNSALAPPKAQYHQKSAVPTCSKPQQSLHRAFYPSHFRQTWGQAASKTPSQVPQGITMAGMFWLAFSQGFLPASSLLKFHLVSQTGDRIFLPFVTQEGILLLSDARNCCVVSRRWTQSQWLPAKLQTMLPRPLFFPRSRAAWPQDMDVHLTAAWSSLLPLHTYFFFSQEMYLDRHTGQGQHTGTDFWLHLINQSKGDLAALATGSSGSSPLTGRWQGTAHSPCSAARCTEASLSPLRGAGAWPGLQPSSTRSLWVPFYFSSLYKTVAHYCRMMPVLN